MVSRFLSYQEAYYSPTAARLGIDNTPTQAQEAVVSHLAHNLFDPLRIKVGGPVYVSSCFRSRELNEAVRGAAMSDHQVLGDVAAIDIDQDGKSQISNATIFRTAREMRYYKLIWEFGTDKNPAWVHLAYSTDETKNSKKYTYRAKPVGGRTVYVRI